MREKMKLSKKPTWESRIAKKALKKIVADNLAKECAKLNPKDEQALADEGLSSELKNWPKY
jgi:hypothetical protein